MDEILKNKERVAWAAVVIVLVLVNTYFGVNYPIPGPPLEEEIVALGTTHFSGMDITGNETDLLVVNQTGTGDLIEFQDGGSVVMRIADGGAATLSSSLDVTGAFNYSTSDLFPVGNASADQELVFGTESITGTATATTGLSAVTWAQCTLGEDPTAGAGDAAHCSVTVTANVVTLKAWQDDFVTAASEVDVLIHWLAIGTP